MGGSSFGPDGDPFHNPAAFAPYANQFSLIGSLDGGVTWQEIGSGPTTVTGPGELLLASNDWIYGDNSGSLGVTITPAMPTAKRDCMNGGWMNYGAAFKNQGDCVSYITTGGKNAPAGS